jgi:hypothetical protein
VSRRSLSETVGPVVYQRIGLVHKVNGPPAAAGRDPHRHRRHKNHQNTTASSHTLQKYAELPGLSNLVVSVFFKILEYSNKSVFLHRIVTRVTVTDVTKKEWVMKFYDREKRNVALR